MAGSTQDTDAEVSTDIHEDYDIDDSLRDRLRVMAEIEAGITLHVADKRGVIEYVGTPHELTENGAGVLTLKAGGSFDNWNYEIVVPEDESEAFLRSVDPNQEYEAYINSRTTELRNIDVRVYGVDHGLLDEHQEVEA